MPPDLPEIVPPETASVWPKVVSALPAGAYLAGGTAVAAHLHHRVSRDLDVFVPTPFDTANVMTRLDRLGELVVTRHASDTLNGVLDGARIQFLYAPMACLDPQLVVAEMPIGGYKQSGQGRELGDVTTLANAEVVEEIRGLATARPSEE
jgi:hypothetical protein